MGRGSRVTYYFDPEVGAHYYGANHPMKPHRVTMAHHLVLGYGLHDSMEVSGGRKREGRWGGRKGGGGRVRGRRSGVAGAASPRGRRGGRRSSRRGGATDRGRPRAPDAPPGRRRRRPPPTPTQVFRPRRAHPVEMAQFHSEEYVDFLARITPDQVDENLTQMQVFNLGEDCPIFDSLFRFCQIYCGGSIEGAQRLNQGLCDVAINWAGGLHHAKKSEASGFCYVNDLVLAILELLKHHPRVLYLDIDIHHGDGVEEAFYLTDRVMTVSFHKYGDFFFPGTGELADVGDGPGRGYSVNVPLRDGIDDATFMRIFRPVMTKAMEVFRPGAIVVQCGADSLASDRLGCFSLSLDGHAEAVGFMKRFGVPMLVTGGGGYTKSNVARCWALETAVLLGKELSDDLPPNDYIEYYGREGKLRVPPPFLIENANDRLYIDQVRQEVSENLRKIAHAPAVQMQHLPPDWYIPDEEVEAPEPDEREGAGGGTKGVSMRGGGEGAPG